MSTTMEVPTVLPVQSTSNPKKRKKRAPTAGAAVDCFACADRKIRCDRRRPYCSQCLDAGQDCSGYKTQLTWGVGVASRGKLRGLSLPVAGTQKLATHDGQPRTKRQKESTSPSTQGVPSTVESVKRLEAKMHIDGLSPRENYYATSNSVQISEAFGRKPETGGLTSTVSHETSQLFLTHIPPVRQPLLDPNVQNASDGQSNSWRHFPEDTTTYSAPTYSLSSLPVTTVSQNPAGYVYSHNPYEQDPSIRLSDILHSPQEVDRALNSSPEAAGLEMPLLPQGVQSASIREGEDLEEVDEEVIRQQYDECAIVDEPGLYNIPSSFDFVFPMPAITGMSNIGKTLRMQYLINYYTEVISPVIIAFDSPNNPFRSQILRLAMSSETLQHAISALSASNLRQRRGIGLLSTGKTAPARRSSMAHVHLIDDKWHAQGLLSPEEQMREETFHKRLAISQLNQQLAHPVLRKDDSILATLLILCLFHICDSGVAKFQTQFAGVRKLLQLRGEAKGVESESSNWMTRIFTCFDSLAATVNDREAQLGGPLLDVSVIDGDWTLENLAGIDGRLCKIFSKLGRINVLRQGKQADAGTSPAYGPVQAPLPVMDMYTSLDGNGWMQNGSGSKSAYSESDAQFWTEWDMVRNELLSWTLDTSVFDSISKEASYLTMEQRIDLNNISQSFRYAALIYLERLAYPQLSSGDEIIQRWVRQSLHYIKQVQSDVYLLWPLFITGTECINDEGRSVIRGRCADIQKDSGFVNNASCLELLEKVWRADANGLSPQSDGSSPSKQDGDRQRYGSSFMFRQVMVQESANGADGEYLVV